MCGGAAFMVGIACFGTIGHGGGSELSHNTTIIGNESRRDVSQRAVVACQSVLLSTVLAGVFLFLATVHAAGVPAVPTDALVCRPTTFTVQRAAVPAYAPLGAPAFFTWKVAAIAAGTCPRRPAVRAVAVAAAGTDVLPSHPTLAAVQPPARSAHTSVFRHRHDSTLSTLCAGHNHYTRSRSGVIMVQLIDIGCTR